MKNITLELRCFRFLMYLFFDRRNQFFTYSHFFLLYLFFSSNVVFLHTFSQYIFNLISICIAYVYYTLRSFRFVRSYEYEVSRCTTVDTYIFRKIERYRLSFRIIIVTHMIIMYILSKDNIYCRKT